MNWNSLRDKTQLEEIKERSESKPQVIFKHSTSCSISSMAMSRLERSWKDEEMQHLDFYYLDLLSFRDVSNAVAEKFNVSHESPQILIIKDGACVYDNSHMGISYQDLIQKA